MEYYNFVQLFAASAMGAALIKLLDLIWSRWLEEKFEKRKIAFMDKRELADEIMKICTEGDSSSYRIEPRDDEHILYIANKVEAEHEATGKNLREYYWLWALICILSERKNKNKESEEFIKDLQDKANALGVLLLKQSRKWKK